MTVFTSGSDLIIETKDKEIKELKSEIYYLESGMERLENALREAECGSDSASKVYSAIGNVATELNEMHHRIKFRKEEISQARMQEFCEELIRELEKVE